MTDLSRREALATSALAALAAATPAWAQQPAAPAPGATAAAWDLTELYPNDAAWDAARVKALADAKALAQWKGRLGESADVLAQALSAQSDVGRTVSRIYTYISLKADEDVRVAANQERRAQATDLWVALGEATAWTGPELIALGRPKIEAFTAQNTTLRTRFAMVLKNVLRQAEHTLSPEGEALLASAGAALSGPGETAEQLRSSDMPRPTVQLSTGKSVRLDDQGYSLNRDAPNRADRKQVFDAFWKSYGAFESSLGSAYVAKIKGDIFNARARKYPSSLGAAVSGGNIPEGVYRTLVQETNAGLPQLHRYFELRRRMLKLPDMAYYDIYPPLVSLDRRFTLSDMRTLTLEATKPLGPEYAKLIAQGTAARWMDPFPRTGKRSGAYMNPGAYDVHPYLLLNLGENYEGLSTYAHEWGHAIHSLLSNRAQPYDMADYPIFLAEIASTANEALLVDMMLKRAKTREEKLFYLGQRMESIRGTFFRQAMFAEFELEAHELAEKGEGVSGARFTALYLDLLKRYHGPKVAIDPAYAIEWAYIPHFYSNFYVYQYATSITAAEYFARSVLTGGAAERDRYLTVLKAGGSDYPIDILKRAGLDMTSPEPYRQLVQSFKETLDQAEALLG